MQSPGTTSVTLFLRLALGVSFLSAVADRFGFWGRAGAPHVAWGDFAHFIAYTAKLNAYAPRSVIPAMAWISTVAETLLGLALIIGLFTRSAAFLSGLLLLAFALAMFLFSSPKAPLDASVFTASAGAFLLSTCAKYPASLDALLNRRS